MKKLILALFFPLACAGATITGYIIDQTGAAKTGNITIAPMYQSMLVGTQYVSGARATVTLTNGGFTNNLIQGDYLILIGGTESPRISVPDDTNTYNFVDLINTNGLLYQWKSPGSVVKLDGSDSVFGFLGDKLLFTAPITGTTNNVGANESLTLSMPIATNLVSGYLLSTDWDAFNAKQPALGFDPMPASTALTNLADGIGTGLTNLLTDAITNAVSGIYQPASAALSAIAGFTLVTTNLDVLMAGGTTNRLQFSAGVLTNVVQP